MKEMIIVETENDKEIQIVSDGLDEYNEKIVGKDNHKKLNLVIRNNDNQVIAGLIGGSYWGWLYVERLWVHEKYRSNGLGKKLIIEAERIGIERGCENCHIDTMSFQALNFYKKLGYEVKCEIKDIPKGHSKYHLVKHLK